MCIAILKTKEGFISDEILENCCNNNPNGAGIAYTKDNKLYIVKGIFDVNEFVKQYHKAEKLADNNMLIHCRISTSGLIDKDNCHPHVVNNNTVLIHNGILDIKVPVNSKKSDTRLYIDKYLADLPEDFIYNKSITNLIEYSIGLDNKFIFLNSKGDYKIINEKSGQWIDGVWYSNTSYKNSYKLYSKTYNYYNYDRYGEFEDDRYDFLNNHPIDYSTKNKIKNIINSLYDSELEYLGAYPVIDIASYKLRPEPDNMLLNKYEFYLYELDDELDELYSMRYSDNYYGNLEV